MIVLHLFCNAWGVRRVTKVFTSSVIQVSGRSILKRDRDLQFPPTNSTGFINIPQCVISSSLSLLCHLVKSFPKNLEKTAWLPDIEAVSTVDTEIKVKSIPQTHFIAFDFVLILIGTDDLSHACPHRCFAPNFAFAFAFVILKVIIQKENHFVSQPSL